MPEPVTWIGIAALTISNIGIWIDKIMVGRRMKNDKDNNPGPGPGPGIADICIERGQKIAVIENQQENIKETLNRLENSIEIIRAAVVK